ncbi:hypothetical protein [Trinickia mobilis]|uniref:hypothetical protein n=1 Tax=Trinickia mobilis TaxID=2816356 RepID=UPI002867BA8D|nr:hypothetical protein [Trinickia mobilis]
MSSDTENKLARAAESAQRLAQLSDVSGDAGTGDLFGDDPARAVLEALNIDARQGTLAGFELPGEVLAPSSAAVASAIRSVASARRQSAARSSESTMSGTPRPGEGGGAPDETAAASVETVQSEGPPQGARSGAASAGTASAGASARAGEGAAEPAPASAQQSAAPSHGKAFAREAAPYAPAGSRRAPDLDWARATAFADTVDALYGVIADQRRAAGDHSRRMKWLLSIVVAALLVTIAIGITQTALLMRLTHESTARQQRIEDMLRGQQATLTTLVDAAASASARAPANEPAPAAPVAPVTRRTPQASAGVKHAKPQQHPHKPKAVATR